MAATTALITLAHGAGGTVMQGFIMKHLLKLLTPTKFEVPLEELDDAAVVNRIVFMIDRYRVKAL